MKATGPAELPETTRWDRGATWIAHPEETMRRASHAVATDEGAWLIDPVDADGLDDLIDDLDGVAGVAVLFERHKRDAAAIARRHDVPVHVHESMTDTAAELDAEVRRFDDRLADTELRVLPVVQSRFWREVAVYDEDDGTLIVPETLGTAEYFLTGDERLGVHPMLRLLPPTDAFRSLESDPERVLCGHGLPVLEDADEALAHAVSGARRRTPALYLDTLRTFLPW